MGCYTSIKIIITRGSNKIDLTTVRSNVGFDNPLTQLITTYNNLPEIIIELFYYSSFIRKIKIHMEVGTYFWSHIAIIIVEILIINYYLRSMFFNMTVW